MHQQVLIKRKSEKDFYFKNIGSSAETARNSWLTESFKNGYTISWAATSLVNPTTGRSRKYDTDFTPQDLYYEGP